MVLHLHLYDLLFSLFPFLLQVMCQNTLYNEKTMMAFMNNKPLSLVQPYFLCALSSGAAFSLAVGNAAGTSGLVASMAMLFLGYAFRRIHNKRAKAHARKRLEQLKAQAAAKAAFKPLSSKSSLMSSGNPQRIPYGMSHAFCPSSHPCLSHRWEKNRDKIVVTLVFNAICTNHMSMSFNRLPS